MEQETNAKTTGTGAGASEGTPAPGTGPEALGADDIRQLRESLDQVRAELADAREQARTASLDARRAQSTADAHADRLRKQLAERQQRLYESLPQLGLDADQVRNLREEERRASELEELRDQVARQNAERLTRDADSATQREIRDACEEAGIDPRDKRLDLSGPVAFYRSLNRIVREEAGKAKDEGKGKTKPETDASAEGEQDKGGKGKKTARNAREDLDVLGGGGGAAGENPDREFREKFARLRGTGRVADAMALMREHDEKKKR